MSKIPIQCAWACPNTSAPRLQFTIVHLQVSLKKYTLDDLGILRGLLEERDVNREQPHVSSDSFIEHSTQPREQIVTAFDWAILSQITAEHLTKSLNSQLSRSSSFVKATPLNFVTLWNIIVQNNYDALRLLLNLCRRKYLSTQDCSFVSGIVLAMFQYYEWPSYKRPDAAYTLHRTAFAVCYERGKRISTQLKITNR